MLIRLRTIVLTLWVKTYKKKERLPQRVVQSFPFKKSSPYRWTIPQFEEERKRFDEESKVGRLPL